MRTLRKLPATSLSVAADTFLLPGQLPMRLCAQRPPATALVPRFERSPWPVARIALSACKDRPLSAGLMPLTVLGANAHGPPDSDKRMCAQR